MNPKISFLLLILLAAGSNTNAQKGAMFTISTTSLQDKIKGGWAGQTIGVTYGGPVEFRFNGTMINDYQPIIWYDGYIKKTMEEIPGLYDDLYMDLTFVDVFERKDLRRPLQNTRKHTPMRGTFCGMPTRPDAITY